MRLEQGAWADVHVGAVLYDPVGERAWRIVAAKDGWFQAQDSEGNTKALPPQDADVEMQFVIPSDAEMIHLLQEELGARTLGLLGALASQPARARRSAQGFPSKRVHHVHRAKSHLELMHNVYVGDVKTMLELHEAHDAMHADPAHLMRYAHHHTGD